MWSSLLSSGEIAIKTLVHTFSLWEATPPPPREARGGGAEEGLIPPAEAVVISDGGFWFLMSSEILSPLPTGPSLVQIFLWVIDL